MLVLRSRCVSIIFRILGKRRERERKRKRETRGGITWKFSTYTVDYCRTEIVVASSPGSLPFFDCSPDTTCSPARTTTA